MDSILNKDEIRQMVKQAFEDNITTFIVGGVAGDDNDGSFEQDPPAQSTDTHSSFASKGVSEEVTQATTLASVEPMDVTSKKKPTKRNQQEDVSSEESGEDNELDEDCTKSKTTK